MLEIPKRTTAFDNRDRCEIIIGRRRSGGPLEAPRIPRVVSCGSAFEHRPQHVEDKNKNRDGLNYGTDGDDEVPNVPATAWFVGVDAARHAQNSWDVHRVESQVEADDKKPEVPSRQGLAVHAAAHFGEPVIEGAKNRDKDGANNHIVEMGNHKI